jgi:1-acyl-sn-glycerol-3-phosphate acyltransferase
MAELVYPPVLQLAKGLFRALGLRITVEGAEHIPRTGGAVLASTHVSYLDFIFVGYPAYYPGRRMVRFMAKKQVFDHKLSGPLMRGMHHIPVDRKAGAGSYRAAITALTDGEMVGVFPEATISRSFTVKELKTGAARLAIESGTPLVPVAIWGTQRLWTKGRPRGFKQRGVAVSILVGEPIPIGPDDKVIDVTARLSESLQALLDRAQAAYPQHPNGTEDPWWLPTSMGGTAPTRQQAKDLDAADYDRR